MSHKIKDLPNFPAPAGAKAAVEILDFPYECSVCHKTTNPSFQYTFSTVETNPNATITSYEYAPSVCSYEHFLQTPTWAKRMGGTHFSATFFESAKRAAAKFEETLTAKTQAKRDAKINGEARPLVIGDNTVANPGDVVCFGTNISPKRLAGQPVKYVGCTRTGKAVIKGFPGEDAEKVFHVHAIALVKKG